MKIKKEKISLKEYLASSTRHKEIKKMMLEVLKGSASRQKEEWEKIDNQINGGSL